MPKELQLTLTGAGKALLSAAYGHLGATLAILESSPAPAATLTDGVHLALRKATKWKKGKKLVYSQGWETTRPEKPR